MSDLLDPVKIAPRLLPVAGLQQRIGPSEGICLLLIGTQHIDIRFMETGQGFVVFTFAEIDRTDQVVHHIRVARIGIVFQIAL